MTVRELARQEELELLFDPRTADRKVARFFASNTMSELIANAARDTLLVTSLNNIQLIRVAELMDAPGICLVSGTSPCAEFLEGARRVGTAILVSPRDLEATRARLEERLRAGGAPGMPG
jgi:hypothetical protein